MRRLVFISIIFGGQFASAEDELEEIVVTASLRAQDIRQIPASVTVLDSPTLQATTLEPVVLGFESHNRVKIVRVYSASRGTNGDHVVTSHTTNIGMIE